MLNGILTFDQKCQKKKNVLFNKKLSAVIHLHKKRIFKEHKYLSRTLPDFRSLFINELQQDDRDQ